MKVSKRLRAIVSLVLLLHFFSFTVMAGNKKDEPGNAKRIVNIVNFIRQSEPRDAAITETVLFETVREQILLLSRHKLPGTYLLQYDALINPRYQQLLKTSLTSADEIGGWWEITQPHVEAAGLKWRGRYSWDWHADVGFSTGYSPAEREKLVDVYMEKFKSIFGKYPTSVASWFIDEHSLAYMYDKYGIVASANCKDQVGTDGYTLWGGYWNQAYYPSRVNAYMPAQNSKSQIAVPVFRMLGSDPIYQYESGIGGNMSGVISLEPVYQSAGGDRKWIEWFMKSLADEPCLTFAYTQAGQENSFTWAAMKKGLEIQIPLFDSLQKAGKIRVETLSASGKWFKTNFPLTPVSAVTALHDYQNKGNKTIWFNSRFYRASLLWKGDAFRFRDIHLFDEKFASPYLNKAGTSTQCIYKTLPVLDGFSWSSAKQLAGLRIISVNKEGKEVEISCNNITVKELKNNVLEAAWTGNAGESFRILFFEDRFEVRCNTKEKNFNWFLELTTASGIKTPFTGISTKKLTAMMDDFAYNITCKKGSFIKPTKDNEVLRIIPAGNSIVINCANR